jgi:hypothetical protein
MKTVNEVYNSLGGFLLSLLSNEEWSRAELNLKIQPNVVGMSGKCYTSMNDVSLRTKFDNALEERIKWLHTVTTEGEHNKWNKAKFSITPDNKFDMEFIWDETWQEEVNRYNKQEEERDPSYTRLKWHWEK